MLQVGEVSRRLDINAQTIYFYERIGLIPKLERTESGYRHFGEYDLERLAFILRLKALGLGLNEIKEILALQSGQKFPCQTVHALLLGKVGQIEKTIAQLQNLKGQLLPLVQSCEMNLTKWGESSNCTVFREEKHET